MEILHISDYYNNKTGHALNNIVERLAKNQKIKVYTSKYNPISIHYDDSDSKAEIKRFRGIKIGSKIVFPELIPEILFRKSPDIIHTYVMGFFSTFVVGYLRKIKKFKMVLFSDFDKSNRFPKSFFGKLYWKLFIKMPSKSADIITVFTKQQKKDLSEMINYPLNKIEVVPSGVDFNLFQTNKTKKEIRRLLNLPKNKLIILSVGNFGTKRRYEMTINILNKLNIQNCLFIHIGAIGDEEYYKKIKKLVKIKKLESQTLFLGAKPLKDIIPYYQCADVFLLTSHDESFGIPIIEAMAAGLPVVTTKVGVVEDAIQNRENGVIINNEKEGIKAIEELAKNKKLYQKVSTASKETAKTYDWDIIVKKIEKIYNELLKK
jgi:glycosyltransferase involved in cell wall biosynthesis